MAEDSPRIMEDDRDDVEALKEQHAQWLEDLDGKLKKPCCCKKKGCMEFRKRYRYGAAMMRFSSKKFPEARLRRHLLCLKLDPDVLEDTVKRVATGSDVRIALWHYFPLDRDESRAGGLAEKTTDARALASKMGHPTPHPGRALQTVGEQLGAEESPSYMPAKLSLAREARAAVARTAEEVAQVVAEAARAEAAPTSPSEVEPAPWQPGAHGGRVGDVRVSPDGKSGFRARTRVRSAWGMVSFGQLHHLVDTMNEHLFATPANGGCIIFRMYKLTWICFEKFLRSSPKN